MKRMKDKRVNVGRPRDVSADEAILRAAMDLFSEYGFEGASIEQIAKRAGVARTTVYRRWSGSEDLIVHAIEHAKNFPNQLHEDLEKLPPDELVNLAVNFSSDTLTRPQFRKLAVRLIGSTPSHPALMSVYQRKYLRPRRQIMRRLLEGAQGRDLLPRNTDVEVWCDMFSGAMMYALLFRPEELSKKKVRAYVLRLFRQSGFIIPR